jgi:hypothetical protein
MLVPGGMVVRRLATLDENDAAGTLPAAARSIRPVRTMKRSALCPEPPTLHSWDESEDNRRQVLRWYHRNANGAATVLRLIANDFARAGSTR